jgi:hypothetical protein
VKQEPIKLEEEKKEEEVVMISDFIRVEKNDIVKTEAYYCTKIG